AAAVARPEAVGVREGAAQALGPVTPGEGVLPASADVAAGATLLAAGRSLGGVEIAILTAAGVTHVRVRAPRLRLVRAAPTGDAVIDAVIACIVNAIALEGGISFTAAQDDLAEALADAAGDAVIVVGGTGSGRPRTTVRTVASIGEVL